RVSDVDLDVLWLQRKLFRNDVGEHAARAGADVLHRAACDDATALDGELDGRPRLPEIKPVARGDADAAAVTAALCGGRLAVAPGVETRRPVVEPLPVRIGIPA